MTRRIMHLDMDAFYAAVEQADNPELKGRPVIVGGGKRGVVSAASYEARTFGVHSAMPVFQAKRICPCGVFLPVRMARYKEASRMIMDILSTLSPLVEQISIDEAFVDITGTESLHGPPVLLCRKVKQTVRDRTSLTCSIGVAPNKFLAKIASDMNKPDGLTIVEPGDIPAFLNALPIHRIPGVGAKTAKSFKELGVEVASDVLRLPLSFWVKRLGKYGAVLYDKAQGIDSSPVVPYSEPKSVSAEDTFRADTDDVCELEKWLLIQAEGVGKELREDGRRGRTITLKAKFSDFKTVTRSRTLNEPTDSTEVIFRVASRLLRELNISKKLRLIGVGVSNLASPLRQRNMFSDAASEKGESLDRAMDEIRKKYGEQVLKRGRVFDFEP